MQVGLGHTARDFCDGQSLASPGRWSPTLCTHEPDLSRVLEYTGPGRIAAATTAGTRDAATSGEDLIAAAATAGEKDAATSWGRANRSPRTRRQPSGSAEPGRKETEVTAGNKTMTSVRVFFQPPGSRWLASGLIRQNVRNLVSLLPPSIRRFGTVISCTVQ